MEIRITVVAAMVAVFGLGWLVGLTVPTESRPWWAVYPALWCFALGGWVAAIMLIVLWTPR